jgi:ribosome maturation factor RimP
LKDIKNLSETPIYRGFLLCATGLPEVLENKVGRRPIFCLRRWVMKRDPYNLKEMLEPAVNTLGCELVGIEYLPSGRHSVLRVYIDKDGGVTLEDCQSVSHQVSGILDVEDPIPGQYTLEVSSPGLDRLLFDAKDFERFAGHRVTIRNRVAIDGRRKFTGLLLGLENDDVVIRIDDDTEILLPLDQVEQARLVPDL